MKSNRKSKVSTFIVRHKVILTMIIILIVLGVVGYFELTKYNPNRDLDGDGSINKLDSDDNNDGIKDVNDPRHPEYDGMHLYSDFDGDGLLNNTDPDDDNDGILDVNEHEHENFVPHHPNTDLDMDGLLNKDDDDDDGDTIPDSVDFDADYDLDGIINKNDTDDDNDGVLDINDPNHVEYANYDDERDYDSDGIVNKDDPDDDNDGIEDFIDLDHRDCIFKNVIADTSVVEENYEGYIPAFYFHGEKTYSNTPILIYEGKILQTQKHGIGSSVLFVDTSNDIVHHSGSFYDMCEGDECGKGSRMNVTSTRFYVDENDEEIRDERATVLAVSNDSNYVLTVTSFSKGEDVKVSIYSVLNDKTIYTKTIGYNSLNDLYFDYPSYKGEISDNGRFIYLPILEEKVIIDTKTNKKVVLDDNITPYEISDNGELVVYTKFDKAKSATSLFYLDERIERFDNQNSFEVFKSDDNSFIISNYKAGLYIKDDLRRDVEFISLSENTLTEDQKRQSTIFYDKFNPHYLLDDKVYDITPYYERRISIDNPNISLVNNRAEFKVVKKSIDGDNVGLHITFKDEKDRYPSITFVDETYYVSFTEDGINYLLAFNESGVSNVDIEVRDLAKVDGKLYATDGQNVYDIFDDKKIVYTVEKGSINEFFSFRNNVYFQELSSDRHKDPKYGRIIKFTKDFSKISSFDSKVGFDEVNFAYFFGIK